MKSKLLVLVLIVGIASMALGWENFALNPYFELDSSGEVNLTEREFDCLGWTYWCTDTTLVTPCDDRPPARMMAIVGDGFQCSIWQTDWNDYTLEADTQYLFEVDLKSVDGCDQVHMVLEDETYTFEANKIFTITDQWGTYSMSIDTTEYTDFVGLRVGCALRVYDTDGGSFAATNLCFHKKSDLVVVNYSFELPGTGKIQNDWGRIPGWESDYNPIDSGVEEGWLGTTDGEWTAYLYNQDPSVYNLTSNIIEAGRAYTLLVDAQDNWSEIPPGEFKMSLYYDDAGSRVTVASEIVNVSFPWSTFSLSFAADDVTESIGRYIGIELKTVTPEGNSWLGLDNIRLNLEIISVEIEAEVEFKPDFLDLQAKVLSLGCRIYLPEGYDVADIDQDSIFLEDDIAPTRVWLADERPYLQAKFDGLQSLNLEPGQVDLEVSGNLNDGTPFSGIGTITVE